MQRPSEAAGVLATILKDPGGRMRLGWRLSLFVILTGVLAVAAAFVLPQGTLADSFALLVGAGAAGTILLALDGRPAAALGFHVGRSAISETALGLLLGSLVGAVVVALMAGVGVLTWAAEGGSPAGWLGGAASALLFLAVPAAAEEALLRGYPIQAIAEARGPVAALMVTSGVFGAIHLGNPNVTVVGVINVTVAGAFLGVVYLKTLSLWWATGAHIGWNWTHGYLADVPVSGLELMDAPLYDGVVSGPGWLGGGAFGPEGSVVATVVVVAATALCWRASWLRPAEASVRAGALALNAVPLATSPGGQP
ncbi:MAG: lysostaphin resistance A-like protein [Gemmatimonadales bacterium]